MSTIADLVPTLLQKTCQDKLTWKMDDNSGPWIKIGESIVQIEKNSVPDKEQYLIEVRNSTGIVVDDYSQDYDLFARNELRDLFIAARRSALKSDEIVEDIIKQLDKI